MTKSIEESIKSNDLYGFLKAALDLRKKLVVQAQARDEIQEMIDFILNNTKSKSVINFIGGVNVFKRTMALSPQQITCVRSTYNGLKEIEQINITPNQLEI